jgi:formylglycine-generating enzyme required for sulfatase activity
VAVLDGKEGGERRFHEVFRLVPEHGSALPGLYKHQKWAVIDGVVHLPEVILPPADVAQGMCLFPGADEFVMGLEDAPLGGGGRLALVRRHRRAIRAFYLDRTEVTKGAFGPWLLGPKFDREPGDRNFPAVSLTWDQAAAYAEKVGKRLPDEAEYEYAATCCGTRRFPWGDSAGWLKENKWPFGPAGRPEQDRVELSGQPPVFGLYSNVAEWTSSWVGGLPGTEQAEPRSMLRVVRGAPPSALERSEELRGPARGPRERLSLAAPLSRPGLGFRCARSARARWSAADFGAIHPAR